MITPCPRCGHKFDDEFSALSRLDNKTHICSDCGVAEALENWVGVFIPNTDVYWDDTTEQAQAMRQLQLSQSPK